MILRIATRQTPLAILQAEMVAAELQKIQPDLQIELVKVITDGDRNLSAALTDGQNFFTKEIDSYVSAGLADCAVHSLKDTSIERPSGIIQAAFLERDDPRDIIIFHKKILEKLQFNSDISITIGTSSPRREQNIPEFLRKVLPTSAKIVFTFVQIRGSVGTRLSKIGIECDCTALSSCGIGRLIEAGLLNSEEIFADKLFFMVPASIFPGSPGQGTIVIECLRSSEFLQLFRKINHAQTETDVIAERNILQKFGGGCHQKFGVASLRKFGIDITVIKGHNIKGEDISNISFTPPPDSTGKLIDSGDFNLFSIEKIPYNISKIESAEDVFVSHANAVTDDKIIDVLRQKRIYVPGIATWQKLAKLGIWVCGCSESRGFETLESFSRNSAVKPRNFTVLTHEDAVGDDENSIATYRLEVSECQSPPPLRGRAGRGEVVMGDSNVNTSIQYFWKSPRHFEVLSEFCNPNAIHMCIEGKTKKFLESKVSNVYAFQNVHCYEKWKKETIRSHSEELD